MLLTRPRTTLFLDCGDMLRNPANFPNQERHFDSTCSQSTSWGVLPRWVKRLVSPLLGSSAMLLVLATLAYQDLVCKAYSAFIISSAIFLAVGVSPDPFKRASLTDLVVDVVYHLGSTKKSTPQTERNEDWYHLKLMDRVLRMKEKSFHHPFRGHGTEVMHYTVAGCYQHTTNTTDSHISFAGTVRKDDPSRQVQNSHGNGDRWLNSCVQVPYHGKFWWSKLASGPACPTQVTKLFQGQICNPSKHKAFEKQHTSPQSFSFFSCNLAILQDFKQAAKEFSFPVASVSDCEGFGLSSGQIDREAQHLENCCKWRALGARIRISQTKKV